jgi:tetratricopeptide (TPR) repeat protein
MEQHLTSQDLAAFAKGELPREAARAVVSHLLRGCTACRSESASRWHLGQSREPLPEDAYDAGFERVLALVQGGRERAAEQVTALLQRAWELRHESPEETRRSSRMAVLAADALDAGQLGAPQVADLRGRAWASYGNACRIAGDLDEARQALDRAAEILTQGTGDLGDRAQLYEFQASLEAARGSYDSALVALDAAYSLHQQRGDSHLAGRDLIIKGLYLGHTGRSREAFRITQRGLGMVEEAREPGLVLAAIHNQLWFLVESSRLREARSLLGAHRDRLSTGEAQRLDLLWLEGRIQAGLRNEAGGLRDLETAEEGFAAAGRRFQAANVKLDQAAIHLRRGDSARALALVRAAEEAFLQLEVPTSTSMAMAFLRRTLAERTISAPFVLRLADMVRRGQHEAVQG